jgi:hypothetical protein
MSVKGIKPDPKLVKKKIIEGEVPKIVKGLRINFIGII